MNMETTAPIKIDQSNVKAAYASMRERHDEMLNWSRKNSNELGGMFGAFQKAMGETDVPQEIETYLGALAEHGEVFYVGMPTFLADDSDLAYSTVRRKERSPEAMLEKFKGYLKEGRRLYIHSIARQPACELPGFGIKAEEFLMTQFAVLDRKK